MKNNHNISFVIPAYNCADTIKESIDSIFDDNYKKNDEIIIINDFSTDKTDKVIKKICNKYPQIKYLKNDNNKGCPATRNIGIKIASNPLIFNLDSDNILERGSIKRLKDYLLKEKADMAAFSEYHFFQKNKKNITHKWIFEPNIMTLADFMAGPINPGPGGNFLFTKKSWEKVKGYWEYGRGLHEAWGFTLKQLVNGSKFVVLPKSYYYHRYGQKTLFATESKKENENSLMATKMIKNYINILDENDQKYILSESGSKNWFDNFFQKPIHLKNGEIGKTGYDIKYKNKNLRSRIKRVYFLIKIYNKITLVKNYFLILKDYIYYKKINNQRFELSWKSKKFCLSDKTKTTPFDTHYIYHPAWALRQLTKINPTIHYDISSTLNFSTMASAFFNIEFYDYRPVNLKLSNLKTDSADLLSLPFKNDSISSLSCMHTIEHIGLGRYGDKIESDGDIKAINELKRVLAVDGNLLFVVPIGKSKLIFNAHRIYSYEQIISYFKGLKLINFTLIPDNAIEFGIIDNATKEQSDAQKYGCGCFWFKK